jgi:thiamine pyrophosphokinase
MTGLAFIGGEAPTTQQCKIIAKKADYIAAADSGLIRAEEVGLIPDIIAGDMDSLDDESRLQKYPRESIRRYPVDKDQTDTEIVIQLLEERGCSEIILIGGGGGRLAHIFAKKSFFEKQTLV